MIVVTIITYMSVILNTVTQRYEYKIDESSVVFAKSGILDMKFGQISNQLPTEFELGLNLNDGY